mgnify:CR=1 FL=1
MKAKPFYKNNKHNNNMDSKEKENTNEEELKHKLFRKRTVKRQPRKRKLPRLRKRSSLKNWRKPRRD